MKKGFVLLFALLLFSLPVFAGDFGITIDASTGFKYTGGVGMDPLLGSVKASLWGNISNPDTATFEFQGGYTLNESRLFLLALDQFQISAKGVIPGSTPVTVSFKWGRFPVSEFSGKVFSHTGDGFSMSFGLPWFSISMFGVYTGLIQAPNNTILMTNSDIADRNVDPVPYFGPLGAPRTVEGVSFTFPDLFGGQTLILSGVFQQDLRGTDQLIVGGNVLHTFYAGLGLTGPLGESNAFFYKLYGYGNAGINGADTILSFLAGGGLTVVVPTFLSSRFSLETVFAYGDEDHSDFYEGNTAGYSTAFVPVTPAPAGMVFTPQQTNLWTISATASIKPFPVGILFLVKPTVFFRPTTGPISTGGVKSGETGLYLGTEVDVSIMARLLSDLGLSINSGFYFPSPIMESTGAEIKLTAALSFTL